MTDELSELKARVAELEARTKPPPPPDMRNYRPYDPTEHMTMPVETLRDMVNAVPDHRQAALHDARSPSGLGMVPEEFSAGERSPLPQSTTPGWVREAPLTLPPGVALADKLMDAQDAKDRYELMQAEARRIAATK
jgi:hypothetical protein